MACAEFEDPDDFSIAGHMDVQFSGNVYQKSGESFCYIYTHMRSGSIRYSEFKKVYVFQINTIVTFEFQADIRCFCFYDNCNTLSTLFNITSNHLWPEGMCLESCK